LRELSERYIQLGKTAQAHAALDKLIAEGVKGRAPYQTAVRAKAVLLAQEKKFDAADKMLARLSSKEKLQKFWFFITKAKIETAKGNSAEAEQLYDKAFAMKGIPLPIIRFQKIEAGKSIPKFKEKK
jgi:predicted Zn-dependent protease